MFLFFLPLLGNLDQVEENSYSGLKPGATANGNSHSDNVRKVYANFRLVLGKVLKMISVKGISLSTKSNIYILIY